jgi:hypothetical protein
MVALAPIPAALGPLVRSIARHSVLMVALAAIPAALGPSGSQHRSPLRRTDEKDASLPQGAYSHSIVPGGFDVMS